VEKKQEVGSTPYRVRLSSGFILKPIR
jgi:hypothetical protein